MTGLLVGNWLNRIEMKYLYYSKRVHLKYMPQWHKGAMCEGLLGELLEKKNTQQGSNWSVRSVKKNTQTTLSISAILFHFSILCQSHA